MTTDRPTRVYTKVRHEGAIIHVAGQAWVIDSVDVTPGDEAYEAEAVAYLSPLPKDALDA